MTENTQDFDRVWLISWVFPANLRADVPDLVAETVRDVAATMGAVLAEVVEDNHDDIGGGDPDLVVWRFEFRVPGPGEPAEPSNPAYRDRDFWPVTPPSWPPLIARLAGVVAGLAGEQIGPGRLEVEFSPTRTICEIAASEVAATYDAELALIERTLEPFREAHTAAGGRVLPDRLIQGYPISGDVFTGTAVFYVGEEAYESTETKLGARPGTYHRWLLVCAGLDLPAQRRHRGLGADGPVLVVPPPPLSTDTRWLLTLDEERFAGPLQQALTQLTDRLRQLPSQ